MRLSGLLLDDNRDVTLGKPRPIRTLGYRVRDVSEACVTRPLVEIDN